MTVTEITDETYSFFAMEESLCKTNFPEKMIGDTFNIEFCVQASSMLDGHIVSGHIDTV
jgi:riboflavin synthase alpha subunit